MSWILADAEDVSRRTHLPPRRRCRMERRRRRRRITTTGELRDPGIDRTASGSRPCPAERAADGFGSANGSWRQHAGSRCGCRAHVGLMSGSGRDGGGGSGVNAINEPERPPL